MLCSTSFFPTNISFFDELLGGGLDNSVITEIYGDPGAGKTDLCLNLAVKAAENGNVLYFDSENNFSLDRLMQLTNKKNLLNRIFVARISSLNHQKECIENLKKIKDISLIIFDSFVPHYRLKLQINSKEANWNLAEQLDHLKNFSFSKSVPIIITNQSYYDFETQEKHVCGGSLLGYYCKCILEIKKCNSSLRKLIIRKHKFKAEEEFKYYTINEKSIEESNRSIVERLLGID